jgi:hypothetical protein
MTASSSQAEVAGMDVVSRCLEDHQDTLLLAWA